MITVDLATGHASSDGNVPAAAPSRSPSSSAMNEHNVGAHLLDGIQVGGQVIPLSVEGIVDACKARAGKDRVWHPATIYTVKVALRQAPGPRCTLMTIGGREALAPRQELDLYPLASGEARLGGASWATGQVDADVEVQVLC
jgi:hypothetical protein